MLYLTLTEQGAHHEMNSERKLFYDDIVHVYTTKYESYCPTKRKFTKISPW